MYHAVKQSAKIGHHQLLNVTTLAATVQNAIFIKYIFQKAYSNAK